MRVCVYRHKAEVSAYACAYACVVSSLCPVYFSLPTTLRLPVHNTGHPVSTDAYRPGVSRPVKSRSYRHSGRTDSCCYECYQRSQFTEDNAEPSFMPRINSVSVHGPPCQVACANHTCVGEAHDSGQSTSLTQSGVP